MKETARLAFQEEGPTTSGVGETVSRVIEGDVEAFKALVEAHEGAVLGLCRRLFPGNSADAEDLTQETFVRAYRYLDRLEDRERFQPWLYQIARSLCRDRRRRQQVEQRVLAERGEMLRRQTRDGEGDAARDRISLALSDLPLDEREVLVLRYFEGLSYEDLSRRLKSSISQVDHLIRKARARLSRRLAVRQQVESR